MNATELYEGDFVAWADRQARNLPELRSRRWNGPLDLEHLAEEIEDLGRSQRHACESLLEQIIVHLLKRRCAKAAAPRAHRGNEIDFFRNKLQRRLIATIRQHLLANLEADYRAATRLTTRAVACEEPNTSTDIPTECPWSLDDILGSDALLQ